MASPGKHARIALFYSVAAGAMFNKGALVPALEKAKADGQGFGSYAFLDADAFNGFVDPQHSAAVIEGTVPEPLAERIRNAYRAAGKHAEMTQGSFEEQFARYAEQRAGVTSDPPMSQTDNVTADRTSPMAHVETDGRNDPRAWSGATGTSLDGFGLPLTTTDRPGEGSSLAAQGAAVSARAADKAADAGGDGKMADRTKEGADAAAQQLEKEANERAENERLARERAAETGGGDGDENLKGPGGGETGGDGKGAEGSTQGPAEGKDAGKAGQPTTGSQAKPASGNKAK